MKPVSYTHLPYTGQNDVIGYDGLVTLEQLCDVIHEEGLPTEVLAASIEKPQEIVEYALAGADIVTMPYHVSVSYTHLDVYKRQL